jgi:hypothetical protein
MSFFSYDIRYRWGLYALNISDKPASVRDSFYQRGRGDGLFPVSVPLRNVTVSCMRLGHRFMGHLHLEAAERLLLTILERASARFNSTPQFYVG